jgi:DNA-binding NtrC family response regulator
VHDRLLSGLREIRIAEIESGGIAMTELNRPKTVLVVDDELTIRAFLCKLLCLVECETLVAEDGESALDIFNNEYPDLVVSDIYMPKMNGLQLLRAIRRANSDVPVILMTGYSHFKQLIADERSKPSDYLEKPFRAEAFLAMVQKHLAPH